MTKSVSFINIDYGMPYELQVEASELVADDWHYDVENLIQAGFKVTLSTNRYGTGFSVTITDKREKSKNAKVILNAWAGSIGKAFSLAAYFVSEAEIAEVPWLELDTRLKKRSHELNEDFKQYWMKKHAQGKSDTP